MNKMFVFKNKTILAIVIVSILIVPSVCFGKLRLNLNYPSFGDFKIDEGTNINELVAWLYYFIISISGFSAFAMLVRGGFMWMSSAGNPTTIGEARDIINSAILGLIIILASFLILQVINPELNTLYIAPLQ